MVTLISAEAIISNLESKKIPKFQQNRNFYFLICELKNCFEVIMTDCDIDLYADVEGDFAAESSHDESGDLGDNLKVSKITK